MNTFNFKQTEGFPFDADVLHDMQEAYALFNSLGAIVGDKVIVSGAVRSMDGHSISDGIIYVDGELFPFKGGQYFGSLHLVEEAVDVTFEDGVSRTILKKRHYKVDAIPGGLSFNEFKRFDNLADITSRVKKLEEVTKGRIEIVFGDLEQSAYEHNVAVWQARKEIPGSYGKGHRMAYTVIAETNMNYSPPNALDTLRHHLIEDTYGRGSKSFIVSILGTFDFTRYKYFVEYAITPGYYGW